MTPGRLRAVWCRASPLTPTIAILVAVLLFAACGERGDSVSPSSGSGTSPSGGRGELVLRVTTSGGLREPSAAFADVAAVSLYADGTLITRGPQIMIYPPPMLPSLQQRRLPSDRVDAVLAAARDAGLADGDRRELAGDERIADAPTTTVTVTANGRTTVTSAYALGIGERDTAERRALASFVSDVQSGGLFGTDAREDGVAYEPAAIAIRTREADTAGPPPDGIVPQTVDWPLAEVKLAAAAAPDGCTVLRGDDVAAALDVFAQANTETRFTQDGRAWNVAVRPLLPDETDCPR